MRATQHRHQHGFTLLELMTAVTVLAVLAAIATPSFKQFSANSRISATANSIVTALAVARSEALRLSTPVTICPASDATDTACGSSADWKNGWIVFRDGSGTPGQLDGTDILLKAWPAPSNGINVTTPTATDYLQFDARGLNARRQAATLAAATADCTGNNKSQILVTAIGSVQSSKIACP